MKKLILVTGFLSILLISFGTIFKIQHWVGSAFFLFFGNIIFSWFFLPLYCISRLNKEDNKGTTINIIGFLSLIFIFTGITFKTWQWGGGSLLMTIGLIVFVLIALPMYIFHYSKQKDWKIKEFVLLTILVSASSLYIILFALKPSLPVVDTFTKVEAAQRNSMHQIERISNRISIEIENESTSFPEISKKSNEIKDRSDNLVNQIDTLKRKIIFYLGENNDVAYTNYWLIRDFRNTDIIYRIMIGTELSTKSQAYILRRNLLDYKQFLKITMDSLNIPTNDNSIEKDLGIITEISKYSNEPIPWELYMFERPPVTGGLAMLTNIQLEIRNAELEVLTKINDKIKNN